MKRAYRDAHVRFCMDDEMQKEALELLHERSEITGASFAAVISEALLRMTSAEEENAGPAAAETADLAELTRAQEEATREICRRLDAIEERIGESQGRSFPENRVPADEAAETNSEDDRTRMPEIPEGLMAFAFAMGGETDED